MTDTSNKDQNHHTVNLDDDIISLRADDNLSFGAINTNLKTQAEVVEEFTRDLGFDPSNLDEMSKQVEQLHAEPESKEMVHKLFELQKQMGEMLDYRFAQNMEAFKKYIPDIYEQFKEYKPSVTLEFFCTSNGIPNLLFPETNEFFYKVYDPVELCNKQVDLVLEKSPFKHLGYGIDKEVLGQVHHRYLNEISELQDEYFKSKDPELAKKLDEIEEKRKESEQTGELFDASKYEDKEKEDSRFKVKGSCPSVIILGCGLGYHIGYLYEKVEIANLIVIEPNLDLFFASLHTFDWANLLEFISNERRGIYLMIGQKPDQVFSDLTSYFDRHGRFLSCFMWNMIHYRSPEINHIADAIIKDYERTYATLGFTDDHLFAISHGLDHVKHKVPYFDKTVPIPDEYLNTPICVIGNGPSLSKDLPFLRKIQDKVIIVACGTAIETLYNAGIQPTLYCCTERLRIVAEHLSLIPDRDFIKNCMLVTSEVTHPDVIKMFDKVGLFTKPDESLFWLLTFKKWDTAIKMNTVHLMNPLVGNLGLSSATQLGFRKIYLFGLDNGTRIEDGTTHPEENIFYKKISKVNTHVSKENRLQKKGNFGGQVTTNYLYRLSARYMEIIIEACQQTHKDVFYYNCSDGIKIDGAEPVHSETLDWSDLPDFDREGFLDFMTHKKTYVLDISEEEVDNLFDHELFELVIDKMIEILSLPTRPKTRLDYVLMLQSASELVYKLHETRDAYISEMLSGSVCNYFTMVDRILYLVEDEEEAIAQAEKCLKRTIYFFEDIKELSKHIPEYLAENHHKFLNGKIGFDHEDSPAPELVPRKPYVTQEDTDAYPLRKFVKRYQ